MSTLCPRLSPHSGLFVPQATAGPDSKKAWAPTWGEALPGECGLCSHVGEATEIRPPKHMQPRRKGVNGMGPLRSPKCVWFKGPFQGREKSHRRGENTCKSCIKSKSKTGDDDPLSSAMKGPRTQLSNGQRMWKSFFEVDVEQPAAACKMLDTASRKTHQNHSRVPLHTCEYSHTKKKKRWIAAQRGRMWWNWNQS